MENINETEKQKERTRTIWRNASQRYYEKNREKVIAKKLAYYYKKMEKKKNQTAAQI